MAISRFSIINYFYYKELFTHKNTMSIVEVQKKYWANMLSKIPNFYDHRDSVKVRDIKKVMLMNKAEAQVLENFNYDPYFSYRKYIEKCSDEDKIICFTWWYLEGYHFDDNLEMSLYYSWKICKRLGLDGRKVRKNLIDFSENKYYP